MEQVRSFVRHQELRAVGRAQNQCSRRAKPLHNQSIFSRNLALVQQAADFAAVTCGGNRRFNGDRQSVQGSARAVRRVELPRLRAHALRVEVGECIECRIQPLNLPDVGFGQLGHRDLTRAHKLKLPRRRGQHQIVHG